MPHYWQKMRKFAGRSDTHDPRRRSPFWFSWQVAEAVMEPVAGNEIDPSDPVIRGAALLAYHEARILVLDPELLREIGKHRTRMRA